MNLHALLRAYLDLRAALGYSPQPASPLRNFVEFVDARGHTGPVTAELALSWACGSPRRGPGGNARRLSLVRSFLEYVRAWHPATQIPGRALIAPYRRRNAYIYTTEQVRQILQVAATLGIRGCLERATYPTLFGLLVSCGLRLGEALRLTVHDVRLDESPAVLVIQETKFRKSRLAVLHPSTAAALRAYVVARGGRGMPAAFFVVADRRPLSRAAVGRAFDRVRLATGIRPTPDGRRPTLHSMRHTFAVNRMLAWQHEGVEVRRWVPHLSVYMGHSSPKDTYWYLTATPELLRVAAESFDVHANRELT